MTLEPAGDTSRFSLATLLAQALVREGMKNIAAGANPMVVKKGMQKAEQKGVQKVALKAELKVWQKGVLKKRPLLHGT